MPAEPTPSPTRATAIGQPGADDGAERQHQDAAARRRCRSARRCRCIGAAARVGHLAAELDLEAGVAGGRDGVLERRRGSPIRSGSVTGTSYCTVEQRGVAVRAEPRRRRPRRRGPSSASRSVSGAITAASTAGRRRSWTTTGRWRCRRPGMCSRSWSMPAWARAPGTSQSSCGVPPKRAGEGEDGDRDHEPGGDRPPGVGRGGAAETVEEAGHGDRSFESSLIGRDPACDDALGPTLGDDLRSDWMSVSGLLESDRDELTGGGMSVLARGRES